MTKKKWIVVAFALILLVAASLSNIYRPETDNEEAEDTLYDKRFQSLLGLDAEFSEKIREEGSADERILVIPIQGPISSFSTTYNHELIMDTIEKIPEDDSIKAILFELNTPGGSVYETREAYDLFKEIKKELDLPVYASMANVAASGGFYYAMLADKVYASPETITGSIGVIAGGSNFEELYKKIGIENYVYKSGDLKDMGSSDRPPTAEEKKVLQTYIDEAFNRFVQVVVDGRGMSEERVRELADGRIYTASQAKENGLIDDIKYYREVIEIIRQEQDLQNAQVFERVASEDKFRSLFPPFISSETNYVDQFNQILDRVDSEGRFNIEYRWEGGM